MEVWEEEHRWLWDKPVYGSLPERRETQMKLLMLSLQGLFRKTGRRHAIIIIMSTTRDMNVLMAENAMNKDLGMVVNG